MLFGNNMFNQVASKYLGQNKQTELDKLLKFIKKYEIAITNRTKIQDIGKEKKYNEVLNETIEFIEYTNNICSWTEQLMLIVQTKKEILNKKYELENFKIAKQVELLEEIMECTNKTEKAELKKKKIKEALIDLEHELEEVKMHLDFCKIFKNDAERTRELVFSYHQGVKKVGGIEC